MMPMPSLLAEPSMPIAIMTGGLQCINCMLKNRRESVNVEVQMIIRYRYRD